MDIRSDVKQMSKIDQDCASLLIGKQLRFDNVCCI
jgi:hypothetical protein